MIFYAPMRGMREVRDRGTLLPAIICAYASQIVYLFIIQWLVGISFTARPQVIAANLFQAATSLLPIAIVLVPLLALTANMFDRRGSFGLVLQQEYASLASVVFYAFIAANLMTILISIFSLQWRAGGLCGQLDAIRRTDQIAFQFSGRAAERIRSQTERSGVCGRQPVSYR